MLFTPGRREKRFISFCNFLNRRHKECHVNVQYADMIRIVAVAVGIKKPIRFMWEWECSIMLLLLPPPLNTYKKAQNESLYRNCRVFKRASLSILFLPRLLVQCACRLCELFLFEYWFLFCESKVRIKKDKDKGKKSIGFEVKSISCPLTRWLM